MSRRIFVDTNVILNEKFNPQDYEKVYLSIISVEELDGLKNSETKGYLARRAINKIIEADNIKLRFNYTFDSNAYRFLDHKADNHILGFAKDFYKDDNECVFLCDDHNLFLKAKELGLPCKMFEFDKNNDDKYMGYQTIKMTEQELADWYEDKNINNRWDLNLNEYLLLEVNNEIVDKYKWTSNGFKKLTKKDFKSMIFGNLKPKDIYQELCIDSLYNNQFTAITGKAGSGKSLCSLMYIMWALQNQKYDSAIIMYNPVKLRGVVEMGYYSGDSVGKAMQQFIGNMLITKFGDKSIVDTLINQEKIKLISMADCRGMEVSDNQILYITECQNTTADILKICLSRCSKDAKIIIEGDPYQQIDKDIYGGKNNGLIRAIDIFKNEDVFGCVHLPNVWRSKIADIADRM